MEARFARIDLTRSHLNLSVSAQHGSDGIPTLLLELYERRGDRTAGSLAPRTHKSAGHAHDVARLASIRRPPHVAAGSRPPRSLCSGHGNCLPGHVHGFRISVQLPPVSTMWSVLRVRVRRSLAFSVLVCVFSLWDRAWSATQSVGAAPSWLRANVRCTRRAICGSSLRSHFIEFARR